MLEDEEVAPLADRLAIAAIYSIPEVRQQLPVVD